MYDKLFAMYAIKNEDEDRLFVERSSVIKKMKPHDVMSYLGIKDKFMIGENVNCSSRMSYLINMMEQSKYQSINRDSNLMPFKMDST